MSLRGRSRNLTCLIQTKSGMVTGLPFFSVNFDRHFENDRWLTVFPPGPGQAALAVVRNVTYWVHRDWWKFGACDRMGKLQSLYALRGKDALKTRVPSTTAVKADMPKAVMVENRMATGPQTVA